MNGKLIVFEGCDGSGKSTQARMLVDKLNSEKPGSAILVREPGGSPVGEAVRKIFLDKELKGKISPKTELLLIAASRNQLFEDVISKALVAGQNVVMDRYVFSTYVYQGLVGQLDMRIISEMMTFIGIPYPDAVFFMKIPFEEVQKRNATKAKDRLECDDSFVKKVWDAYNKLREIFTSSNIVEMDGMCSIEDLHREILTECQRLK